MYGSSISRQKSTASRSLDNGDSQQGVWATLLQGGSKDWACMQTSAPREGQEERAAQAKHLGWRPNEPGEDPDRLWKEASGDVPDMAWKLGGVVPKSQPIPQADGGLSPKTPGPRVKLLPLGPLLP